MKRDTHSIHCDPDEDCNGCEDVLIEERCPHSACSQHYIDTGSTECIQADVVGSDGGE